MDFPFAHPPTTSRPRNRRGRVNLLWLLLFGAAGVTALLSAMLVFSGPQQEQRVRSLTLYCAAGMRVPVMEIAQRYEQEFGAAINIQFGGSNTLLNQIAINKFDTADLYLAADDFYTNKAVADGLAAETLPLAYQRPVIAVPKGNPKNIATIEDLLRDDVSVVMANPDQAAVGKSAKAALEKVPHGEGNLWQALEKRVTADGVFKPTVNDVATDVTIGSVDAGIVWESTVAMPKFRDDLLALSAPELESGAVLTSIAVLNSTRDAPAALRFARYLAARDRGLPVFAKSGMRPVEGDVWAERPRVTFYCGAVNRRAVEKVVAEFESREGVEVNMVYDGCGILTGRMKTIDRQRTAAGFPDIYMACDVYYLENVKNWFEDARNVSDNEIVLAVPRGSTKVTSLDDLVKPGVRVAVGQPDQCTIGALTRRLLAREQLYDALMSKQKQPNEVVVEKPSSALLVPDVATGHVDVAVAYVSDVKPNRDRVDAIAIDSPLNLAIQPLSIARTSDHKHLMRRLQRRIASAREAFEAAGFRYRLDAGDAASQ